MGRAKAVQAEEAARRAGQGDAALLAKIRAVPGCEALTWDDVQPVSYTHLDVYKRQPTKVMSWLVMASNLIRRSRSLPLVMERGYADCPDMTQLTKKLARLYGADPVSYTHLDVYKRQMLGFGILFTGMSLMDTGVSPLRESAAFQEPVSYTHLDVYKRQSSPSQSRFARQLPQSGSF